MTPHGNDDLRELITVAVLAFIAAVLVHMFAGDSDHSSKASSQLAQVVTISAEASIWKDSATEVAARRAQHPTAAHIPAGSRWDRLAFCESTNRWHIVNDPYTGGLQFKASTWNSFGGRRYARHAYQATRDEQIAIAKRVLNVQGWDAWPVCSIKEGLA